MKRMILLIKAAASMLFTPTRWNVRHNVERHWELYERDLEYGFRAEKPLLKDGIYGEWTIFELFTDDDDCCCVRIFSLKFIWLFLARWVDYRNEALISRDMATLLSAYIEEVEDDNTKAD